MGVERQRVIDFIHREARLMDEHRYDEWLSLWTDDAIYWVPCNEDDGDPEKKVSIIYDDRSRLEHRIQRLKSGLNYAQTPRSRMRRVVGNIEVEDETGDAVTVRSNFVLVELRRQHQNLWAGTTLHKLRAADSGLKMAYKKVILVNNDEELPPLGFLI